MSNNMFSGKRFQLLFRQYFIHNSQFLLLSAMAYVGVIFIVLSLVQTGNGLIPHNLEAFQGFLVGFVTVFGVLYVGHAFPAFRSKESTISYLMLPASVLEKFVFEFLSRLGIILLLLPVLYWVTFHVQGYFFDIFNEETFQPIGIEHLIKLGVEDEHRHLLYPLIVCAVLFGLSVAFTGAAMFTKQPLVKTLFSLAMIVMVFMGYSYLVVEHGGLGGYRPPDQMIFVPLTEEGALKFFTIALLIGTIVMLLVAYRKLKEREV